MTITAYFVCDCTIYCVLCSHCLCIHNLIISTTSESIHLANTLVEDILVNKNNIFMLIKGIIVQRVQGLCFPWF